MINEENIDDLIGKFLAGEASPEEAMLLEDWKAEHTANRLHYERSERLFALLSSGRPHTPDTDSAWQRVSADLDRHKIKPLTAKPLFWRAAAAILVLIGLGVAAMLLFKTKEENLNFVSNEAPKEILLPDGTHVSMYAHSGLRADKGFGKTNRLMHLQGDASFTVVHDEALPFIIDAGQVFIKDIGTRFSVRSSIDTDTVFVHVDEGVVLLFDSLGSSLEIKATEKALYIRSRKQIVRSALAPPTETTYLQFSDKPLGEVVALLNASYRTNIRLQHSALTACTITSRFENEDLETILSIITETLGLSYEKTPEGYIIKGQGCRS